MSKAAALKGITRRCCGPSRQWFDEQLSRLEGSRGRGEFVAAYAAAGRRMGEDVAEVTTAEEDELRQHGLSAPASWTVAEVGRAALLLTILEHTPAGEHVALVWDVYRRGDNGERRALLRALSVLPQSRRFLATALEACRVNVKTVFEAIACENAYPYRYFPEASFNKLVLKALFTGVSLGRIVGLPERVTPELARMAEAYERELLAARRSVPSDITQLKSWLRMEKE